MKIPIADLGAQYSQIRSRVLPTLTNILETGGYIGGQEVVHFEHDFARYCNVKYAVGTSSGTAGLTAAYWALHRDRTLVITQANTFVATVNAALLCPHTDVAFVDCDEYYQMDTDELAAVLKEYNSQYSTIIVVPVHMYGHLAAMEIIMEIAMDWHAVVVEDASHAHGASHSDGRRAGSFGDIGVFSCYPAKPLGACGDAGVVTTNDEDLATSIRAFCNCGRESRWTGHPRVGFTYRLDSIQAAVLLAKLQYLDQWNARKREIAARYTCALASNIRVIVPRVADYVDDHAWYAYPIRVPHGHRKRFMEGLRGRGIDTRIYYPQVVPDTMCWVRHPRIVYMRELRMARAYARELVCLPCYPTMSDEQVDHVINSVIEASNL